MLDEHGFLVLNALYLKKMASVTSLAEITGIPTDEVRSIIDGFVEQDLVLDLEGDLLIQPDGMTQVQDYYRQTYSDLSRRDELERWYGRYETVNSQFIKHVTDWQQTEGDPRVQDRVISTVERLVKLIDEITPLVPRYGSYVRRFDRSVTAVDQGKPDFVCDPTVDSLHNIWFELHEDILLVLDKERTE